MSEWCAINMESTDAYGNPIPTQIPTFTTALVTAKGGGFTIETDNGFLSVIKPNSDLNIQSQITVHELLGHAVSFSLGYHSGSPCNEKLNNLNTLRVENCYNRIHGLPDALINSHKLPDGENLSFPPILPTKRF